MAWNTSTVTLGETTKKTHYDRLRYNDQMIASSTFTFNGVKTWNGAQTINSATLFKKKITFSATAISSRGITIPEAYFCEEQNAGTNGGTFTSGADQQRTLNTTIHNTIIGCSLAANVITLPAGMFEIEWLTTAYDVDSHHSWIANNSGGAIVTDINGNNLIGSAAYSSASTNNATSVSGGRQIITTTGISIKLMNRCTATKATIGYGIAVNLTYKERYSWVRIKQLG